MARPRTGDEPMVMLTRRVPARVPPALTHEAVQRGITVGELIDRLCDRAGFYATPTPTRTTTPIEDGGCEHEYTISKNLAFDTCIHCDHRRYHKA